MKNIIYTVAIALFLISCGEKPAGSKQQQLDALLKEQAAINEKVKALKSELNVESGDNTRSRLVLLQKINKAPFRHFVEVQAKVDGDESINVSPRTQGTIVSITAKEGDKVRKGQVLAALDDQMISQSVAEVQTQYNFAKSIYEKQKNLWDQQIGSEVQYLSAKNNWESLGKRLAAVREQLDMTRIKAPVDGTVDNVQIKIGQAVMPGMPAFQVVNFTGLKVKGEVGEAYAGKINKGDEVVLYFPDLNREINTNVEFAAQTINTLNRTFNVETSITGSLEGISPNMIAVMKIVDYQVDSAIVLPVDVLQRSGEGYYAMVAVNEGGKLVAHRKMVATGKIYNGRAEILSGISETDEVIITGYRDLNDGQELRTK